MLKIAKYLVRKEYIGFLISLGLMLILDLIFRLFENIYSSGQTLDSIKILYEGFLLFGVILILFERLGKYVEKGMVFDNREHFSMIPIKQSTILGVLYGLVYIEVVIFTIVFIVLNKLDSSVVFQIVLILPLASITIFAFGNYWLSVIGGYTNSRWLASILVALLLVLMFSLYIVLVNLVVIGAPYVYNISIVFISLMLLIFGLSYYGTVKKLLRKMEKSKFSFYVLILSLILSIGLFTGGQVYGYSNRLTDDVNMAFESDEDLIGDWTYVTYYSPNEGLDTSDYTYEEHLQHVFNDKGGLESLSFYDDGTTDKYFTWTKNYVLDKNMEVAQHYLIKNENGKQLLFMEWKSGDYIFRHREPGMYVFVKDMD